MQDPRALANLSNLQSYRAWEKESYRRSGFLMIIMSVPVILAPLFIFAVNLTITLFRHAMAHARASAMVTATIFAVYLVVAGGLMLFSVIRLNAWRHAHAWTPPTPRLLVR
jgi:uncharacterized membrane protein YGL010W